MNLDINFLITFQELPENCKNCKYCIKKNSEGDAYCLINNEYVSTLWEDRHVHCPIIKGSISIFDSDGENKFDEEKFLETYDDLSSMNNISKLIDDLLDEEEDL